MDPPVPPPVPAQPQQHQQPLQPQQQQQQPILNWSHFKPEFAGKPAEDAKAHLLHTNDWMNIHNIPADLKVGRFCLTLVGEARLRYESLKPPDKPPCYVRQCWLSDQFALDFFKCLGFLCFISLYAALSLHNSTRLQVHFSSLI